MDASVKKYISDRNRKAAKARWARVSKADRSNQMKAVRRGGKLSTP